MAHLFLVAHLTGWAIESLAVFAASQWLRDDNFDPPRALGISLMAGALWPLVTLGLLQYGAIAAISKIVSDREAAAYRVPADERQNCEA